MRVDRLVSILLILLEKERIGARELAALFEVSPRTIYRDIDAIGAAGVPVRSAPGVGGGFEILRQYKVDRKAFSADDLTAILTGLSGLSGMMRGNELVNALAKIRSLIPADRAKDVERKANQLHIDVTPWISERNVQPYLETIRTALRESRLLSFGYADRYGIRTARTAEPYQLVLKDSHWYCLGYCLFRNDFRLFKLSRISNLQLRAETFTPRDYPKPQLDFSGMAAAMQTQIKLRIHRSVMDRVLDTCADDRFTPDGGEHYLVDFPFIENEYHYDILLSFGDKCECLAPPHIRAEMKRRIRELAALYEN